MTDTEAILSAAGGSARPEVVAAVDALRDCEQASNACAVAMVAAGDMLTEVRRDLDCADVCTATERILSRGPAADPSLVAAIVQAAALACEASAAACGARAEEHRHCQLHAAKARACADALHALIADQDKGHSRADR